MAMQKSRYTKARRIFGVLFLLSALVLLFFVPLLVRSPTSPPDESATTTDRALTFTAATSLLTAVVSLIGLVSTTVLAWRKERRASEVADIDKERQEIELEKARLELEKMREEERRTVVPDPVSLRRQLAKARDNLRLIQERKSQYVMETDVPLQLIREEQHLLERIEELERRIGELEQSRGDEGSE